MIEYRKCQRLWNIRPTDSPWEQEMLYRADTDNRFFAESFMPMAVKKYPDGTDRPNTSQDDKEWAAYDDLAQPKTLIVKWRSGGKTTKSTAKVVHEICYRRRHYIILIGQSLDKAMEMSENIKAELTSNNEIVDYFFAGKSPHVTQYQGRRLSFGKEGWYVSDPRTGEPFCFVLPNSSYQMSRGFLHRFHGSYWRPDYINCQDTEDDEKVLNEDIRKKVRRWFNGALANSVSSQRPNPATDRWDAPKEDPYHLWMPPWTFEYADTPKHEDALVMHIKDSLGWKTLWLPKMEAQSDGTYKSCVPELFTDAQVTREVEQAEHNDSLEETAREMMLITTLSRDVAWTSDMFSRPGFYFIDAQKQFSKRQDAHRFLVVDPARTASKKSAYTGIVSVAVDEYGVWLRKVIREHYDQDEMLESIYSLAMQHNARIVCLLSTGGDDVYRWMTNQANANQKRKLRWLMIDERKMEKGDYGPGKNAGKIARASLIPKFYKRGEFHHEVSIKGTILESSMLGFPNVKKGWDVMDPVSAIPKCMAELGIHYFTPQRDADGNETHMDRVDWDDLTRRIQEREYAAI